MTTVSRLLSEIRNLCGKPSQGELGDDQILSALYDVQTSMTNELNLASTNKLIERAEFQLTAQEMELPVSDFESAERVLVIADSDASFRPLSIVGFDEMPGMTDPAVSVPPYDVSAVAVVGGRLYFDGVPLSARVQLWYKPTYAEPESLNDTIRGVSDAYVPLLKWRTALICKELYLGQTVPPSLREEVGRAERQFKQSRTRGDESGLVKKSRFRSGRAAVIVQGIGGHRLVR